jgi:hypothetical protein
MKLQQLILTMICLGFSFSPANGTTANSKKSKVVEQVPLGKAQVLRVGGTYKVTEINELKDGAYEILFESTEKSGRFDQLRLESDHIHVAVELGSVLRLSAEILKDGGVKADVAQMVLFLPNPKGATPVWMLSNKATSHDLRATKYLDMHVPLNDYSVL